MHGSARVERIGEGTVGGERCCGRIGIGARFAAAAWGVAGCGAYQAGQCVAWEPVVSNGMSLCRLHRAAFDRLILGVQPDYIIRVRAVVLEEVDGPMLMHGLRGLQGQRFMVPSRRVDRPDEVRLGVRWERFLVRISKIGMVSVFLEMNTDAPNHKSDVQRLPNFGERIVRRNFEPVTDCRLIRQTCFGHR